jgi:hypothetical protein
MILFDIDESCRDVYRVGWRARYIMSTWFFPFRVGLSFSWLHNYLFEKRMMLTTNGKSHANNYILPVVGWIFVMIWYIMDVNKQSVLFRSSWVVISYTHFFIIAYKLHWVCVKERGLSSSIYYTHICIYMSIFKETIIIKNENIVFDSFNFNERWFNSVTNSQIFKMKWLHTILCEKWQLKYLMN